MYTLSQRITCRPTNNKSSHRSPNLHSRTIVLAAFENLEDACVALEKKQQTRKNTDEFFIEYRLDIEQPQRSPTRAFSRKDHLKPHDKTLR